MPRLLSDSFQRKIMRLLLQDMDFQPFASYLKEGYFRGRTAQLFGLIHEFYTQYGRIPSDTLLREMIDDNEELQDELELCLSEELPVAQDVVDFLREFVLSHEVLRALEESIPLLQSGKYSEIQDKVVRAVDKGSIGKIEWRTSFDEDRETGDEEDDFRVPTPWTTVNQWLDYDGLRPAEMLVVLAPAKGRKTQFLHHCAVGALLRQLPVLVVTLEMSKKRVIQRFGRMFTGMSWVERQIFPQLYVERLDRANQITGGQLYVHEFPAQTSTVADVETVVRSFEHTTKKKLALLVVDYGALLLPMGKGKNDVAEIGSLYVGVRAIGQRMGFPVCTAAQTGKETEEMEIIRSGHVWRSMEIVQTADYVITIGGKGEQRSRGFANLFLAYSRNTMMGNVCRMQVDKNFWMTELPTTRIEGGEV